MEPNDHDLLIELRTEFRAVRADIKDLKENTIKRLEDVETGKLNIREFHDHVVSDEKSHLTIAATFKEHDDRLRFHDRALYVGITLLTVLQMLFAMFGGKISDALF